MTTTEKERAAAYKVGFLKKIAELGKTPSDFFKKAGILESLYALPEKGVEAGLGLAGEVGKAGLYTAGVLPLAVGGLSGAVSAGLEAPNVEDIEAIRKRELLEMYRKLTSEIRQRMVLKSRGRALGE